MVKEKELVTDLGTLWHQQKAVLKTMIFISARIKGFFHTL